MKNTLLASVLALALAAPAAALASGSTGGGGGGGLGAGAGGAQFERSAPADDPYARGRKVYGRILSCKTCEYPKGIKDEETARAVLKRVATGEFELEDKERQDLTVYLVRRYKLL